MKILLAEDFFTSFELVEAPDIPTAEKYIIDNLNYNEPDNDVTVLGSSDDLTTDEATAQADKILYITDYMTD